MEKITISEVVVDDLNNEIIIESLRITDATFYNFMKVLDESQREDFIRSSIIIGAETLQAHSTKTNVDYVRSEFDKIKNEVERVKDEMNKQLDDTFGKNGAFTKKVESLVCQNGELDKALLKHVGKGGTLSVILNPDDVTTPLGSFKKKMNEMLDSKNEESPLSKVINCIEENIGEVKTEIARSSGKLEGVEEEREKGPAKGGDWEQYVTELLDGIASVYGNQVKFVGKTRGATGDVGDILIRLNADDTGGVERSIVVECKKRKVTLTGSQPFTAELSEAMENRNSDYAIGAIHEDFVPPSVGVFRTFDGNRIIVSVPEVGQSTSLEVAYKLARCQILASLEEAPGEVKQADIAKKVSEIREHLGKCRVIKTNLTEVRKGVDSARSALEEMEEEALESVGDLERIVRAI